MSHSTLCFENESVHIQFYRNICRNSCPLITDVWPSCNLRWFINSFLYWLIFSLLYIFSTTIKLQRTRLLISLVLSQNVSQWVSGPCSGDPWEMKYIPFLLCLKWCDIDSLNMTIVKAFIPWKMADLQTKPSTEIQWNIYQQTTDIFQPSTRCALSGTELLNIRVSSFAFFPDATKMSSLHSH